MSDTPKALRGEVGLLVRLLEGRFGPLPEAVRKRIEEAPDDEVIGWAMKAGPAASLDEVFEESNPRGQQR